MYHSLIIDDINTWDDWHLIPTSRPLVNPPPVRMSFVEIPGMDGAIDLTEFLTGKPNYSNRTGSWEFIVHHEYSSWEEIYSRIMAYAHGVRHKVILEDDPFYYYEGRLSVNNFKSNKNWSTITIDYNLGPYKKAVEGYVSMWIWDTFNFETGIIQNQTDNPKTETYTLAESTSLYPTISGVGPSYLTIEVSPVSHDLNITYHSGTQEPETLAVSAGSIISHTFEKALTIGERSNRIRVNFNSEIAGSETVTLKWTEHYDSKIF